MAPPPTPFEDIIIVLQFAVYLEWSKVMAIRESVRQGSSYTNGGPRGIQPPVNPTSGYRD